MKIPYEIDSSQHIENYKGSISIAERYAYEPIEEWFEDNIHRLAMNSSLRSGIFNDSHIEDITHLIILYYFVIKTLFIRRTIDCK